MSLTEAVGRGWSPVFWRRIGLVGAVVAAIAVGALAVLAPAPIAVGLVGAAAAALVIFAAPWLGLLAVLAFIPFSNFLGSIAQVPGLSIGGVARDALVYLVLAAWLSRLLLRNRTPVVRSPALWWAVGYIGLTALFIPANPDYLTAILGFRNDALFVLFIFVVADLVRTRRRLVVTLFVLLLVGSAMAALGLAEVATNGAALRLLGYSSLYAGTDAASAINDRFLGYARATGGIGNATDFGVFTMIAFIMVAAWWGGQRRRDARRAGPLFLIGFSGAAVAASLARTAWLGAGLGVLAAGFLLGQKRLSVLMLMAGLALFLVYQSGVESYYFDRLLSRDPSSQANNVSRLAVYRQGLQVINDHPLGVGLGSQGSANRDPNSPLRFTLDSYYLQLAGEGGLPLLAAHLVLWGMLIVEGFIIHAHLRDRLLKSIAGGVLACLLAMVAVNITSGSFDSRIISITVWSLVGLLYALPRIAARSATEPRHE